MKLSAQEIRTCVSFGEFTSLLRDLNDAAEWRGIYGPKSVRMKDEELILRFLAFYFEKDAYRRPFARFLNNFLSVNKNLDDEKKNEFRTLFQATLDVVVRGIGKGAFRPAGPLNTAVFDSVMVGLAEQLKGGAISDHSGISRAYEALLLNEEYQGAYRRSTADEEKVKDRMRLATEAFQGVR